MDHSFKIILKTGKNEICLYIYDTDPPLDDFEETYEEFYVDTKKELQWKLRERGFAIDLSSWRLHSDKLILQKEGGGS